MEYIQALESENKHLKSKIERGSLPCQDNTGSKLDCLKNKKLASIEFRGLDQDGRKLKVRNHNMSNAEEIVGKKDSTAHL